MGFSEVGAVQVVGAEARHFTAPGEADGGVGVEEVAEATGLRIVCGEVEDGIPRAEGMEFGEQAKEGDGAFAEEVDV